MGKDNGIERTVKSVDMLKLRYLASLRNSFRSHFTFSMLTGKPEHANVEEGHMLQTSGREPLPSHLVGDT